MKQPGNKTIYDITENILLKEYISNNRSARDIAKEYNTTYPGIARKLKKFGIQRHDWAVKNFDDILTKEFLLEKYVTEELYRHEIAKLVGCGYSCVNKYLMKFKINIK